MEKSQNKNSKKRNGVKCWCYYSWMTFLSRKKAMDFFQEAIYNSDGCEKERYVDIWFQIHDGYKVCTDGAYLNKQQREEVEKEILEFN